MNCDKLSLFCKAFKPNNCDTLIQFEYVIAFAYKQDIL